jgi:hypothetical protein
LVFLVAPFFGSGNQAKAQASPADRITAVERQIRSLQDEVKRLKRELAAARRPREMPREAHARADTPPLPPDAPSLQRAAAVPVTVSPGAPAVAAPAPPPGPHVTQSAKNRFGIESADGRYSIALTGRLHFDAGDYLDYYQPAIPLRLGSGSQ